MRAVLSLVAVCVVAVGVPDARAELRPDEPWYRGPQGRKRVAHLSVSAVYAGIFIATETMIQPGLAADSCRWCAPPGFDASVRRSLVWNDTDGAGMFSNLTGFVALPVFAFGITGLEALAADDASWGRLIDDTLPIAESIAVAQVITQVAKFGFGRERPFVHFGNPRPEPTIEDNLSFFSGHASMTFAIATSAGMIAHWNKSKAEPLVWTVGLSLAGATAYLRIAADKHYLSDVLMGSAVGAAVGLTVPRLLHQTSKVTVAPMGKGVAIAGSF